MSHKSGSHKSHSLKNTGKRSFTINHAYHVDGCPTKFSHGDFTGRFLAFTPQRAASKALTQLCHLKKIRGQCTLYIEMRETTQGHSGKLFAYHAKRVHLKKPIILPNGVERWYHNFTKPVERVPTEKCPGSHKSSGRMVGHHSKLRSHSHMVKPSKSRKSSRRRHSKMTRKSMTNKAGNAVKSAVRSIKKSIKRML